MHEASYLRPSISARPVGAKAVAARPCLPTRACAVASPVSTALPEEAAELRENPEMIRTAVEEILRYESPVQFTARVLKEDIEVCGQRIPKKWSILCMLGAANRDPKKFKEPNQLNLKRLNNEHLAFSAGPHFCIGAQLARLEGQIAIINLLRRFPKMKLTGSRPEWASTFGFRGLKSLPLIM